MHYLSTPTLRFFMFFFLGQVDNYYAEQGENTKGDATVAGPFDLERILYDWKEYDVLCEELHALGLLGYVRECYTTDSLLLGPLAPAHKYYHGILPVVIVVNPPRFRECWYGYLKLFEDGMLVSVQQFYSYDRHDIIAWQILSPLFKKYGNKLTLQYQQKYKDFRFFEYLWILHDQGALTIETFEKQTFNKINNKPLAPTFHIKITETGEDIINKLGHKNTIPPKRISKITDHWKIWNGIKVHLSQPIAKYHRGVISFASKKNIQYRLLLFLIDGKGSCSPQQLKQLWKDFSYDKPPYRKIYNSWETICKKFEKHGNSRPNFKLTINSNKFAILVPKE